MMSYESILSSKLANINQLTTPHEIHQKSIIDQVQPVKIITKKPGSASEPSKIPDRQVKITSINHDNSTLFLFITI